MLLALCYDDAILTILCSLRGPPPEQARALAHLASTHRRLRRLVQEAARLLVEEHMRRTRAELAGLQARYATWLDAQPSGAHSGLPEQLDLNLNLPTSTWLHKLAGSVPKLPLQWTALRNSITRLHEGDLASVDEGSLLSAGQCIDSAGLTALASKGGLRLSWAVGGDEEQPAYGTHARALPFEGADAAPFAAFVLATRLSLAGHPALVDRWRPPLRETALCPFCQRHRKLGYTEHQSWSLDEHDRALCAMPAEVEREASQLATIGSRASARDIEVLAEDDFSDLLLEISTSDLYKCACDCGGSVCRHIGCPPVHGSRALSF